MPLSKNEARLIAGFLDHLCERFGNDGCNDMTLKDTPENRKLLKDGGEDVDSNQDGLLYTSNTLILHHLLHRFLCEYGLTKADIPDVNA